MNIYHNRIVIIKGIPSSFIVVVDPSIRLSFSNRKSSFTDYDSLLNSFGVCLIISLKLPPPQHCGQNRFEKSGWVFFTLFKLFSQLIMYLDFFLCFYSIVSHLIFFILKRTEGGAAVDFIITLFIKQNKT